MIRKCVLAPVRKLGHFAGRSCVACGERSVSIPAVPSPVGRRLAEEWKLTRQERKLMNDREGMLCSACLCNARARQLANVLIERIYKTTGRETGSLSELAETPEFRRLKIAEINACHGLHEVLKRAGNVFYSEYGSDDPETPSEDLLSLSYGDGSFDLVLTSDTIEHVPDIDCALKEIRRVLKPGGAHIFTVPVLMERPKTLRRATLGAGGAINHHEPPSYHGDPKRDATDFLVFYEFGADFPEIVTRAGFDLRTVTDPHNPTMIVYEASRLG
jgi:SAM-dependent methyltransferase